MKPSEPPAKELRGVIHLECEAFGQMISVDAMFQFLEEKWLPWSHCWPLINIIVNDVMTDPSPSDTPLI